MNADLWIGVLVLTAALAALVVVTAAETGVVFVSRLRVRAFAARGLPNAASLERYVRQRRPLLGALAAARVVAVVVALVVAVFLVQREVSLTWAVLAIVIGVALLTLVVLETVPRLLVASNPERWGLRLAPAIGVLQLLFGLPSRLVDRMASAAPGLRRRRKRSFEASEEEEDLLRLVEMHEGNGAVENGELAMIRRVAHMVERAVREIMVPRIDMVAAETDATVDDVLQLVVGRGYSRIPLYEETVDNIVGVVYAKDILTYLAEGRRPGSLREIARPPYFIPEGKHIDELLAELREHKVHMAIVVDEYGGTAGLVTIEDVLEEIVGEIQDEYDREEVTIQRITESEAILDARVSLDALNEMFSLQIEGEDFDTLGGFVYHQLGRMPAPGDEVHENGLTLRVLSVMGRRIKKVRVIKEPAGEQETEEETA